VVDPLDYQLYEWEDWARLTPLEGEAFIATAHARLRAPEVVVLTNYDRVPNRTVPFSRRNVFKRDRSTCQYCGRRPAADDLTIDHVVPRAQGGLSTWENCVLACVDCNSRKANRTPEQAHMPLKKRPTRPLWNAVSPSDGAPVDSWAKFISEAYWTVELEE
jgi:5-methylcytosine-specific restriction endonuclease McrA